MDKIILVTKPIFYINVPDLIKNHLFDYCCNLLRSWNTNNMEFTSLVR